MDAGRYRALMGIKAKIVTIAAVALVLAGGGAGASWAMSGSSHPAPASTTDPRKLPACATEDSNGPCYWDAATRGNHLGHSFWVDAANHVHYLS